MNVSGEERPTGGDSQAGPDTSGYLEYLVTNRDFASPAVAAAVAAVGEALSGKVGRVLDAGTGAGGALPYLAGLVNGSLVDRPGEGEDEGTVLAVDLDARAVEVARAYVRDERLDRVVDTRVADLRTVVAEVSDGSERFDVIWSSDVAWPATFEDPAAVVAELAAGLAPGGVLALFTTNYYQSMFLPGHSRLERLVRTASELTWGLPGDGPHHYERLGAWMRAAGLGDVRLRVFPVAASNADEPVARAFLEKVVWPEMRHAVAARGREAGMNEADVAQAEALLDPASPRWVGADPDTYAVQSTLLWTGYAAGR